MRRRRRGESDRPREQQGPEEDARGLVITLQELSTLVNILEHAHNQIAALSDADEETIGNASGSLLIPSLYARAGVAASGGRDDIPLLEREVGLLEAAVVNLESYEGNEVVLVSGYGLLSVLSARRSARRTLHRVHGILAFDYGAPGSASGSDAPLVPDDGGPELVS
jgi:hypothetical protein